MHELRTYTRRRIYWIIGVSVLGVIVLYGLGHPRFIMGWIWGQLTELLYFILLTSQTRKVPSLPKDKALAKVRTAVLSRFVLIIAMTLIATQITSMSIGAMLVALVLWKPLTYIDYFINNNLG